MPGGRRSDREAAAICQDLMDTLSRAYLAQDFDTIYDNITLPFIRRTLAIEVVIETPSDLARGVEAFSRSLQGNGINQFIRLVSEAEFLSADYIEAFVVAHTFRNATRIFPSYSNRVVLQRNNGCWKMIEHDSALSNANWPLDVIRLPAEETLLRGFSRREDDIRRTAAEPLSLYQGFLDTLSAANLADDFEAYRPLVCMPFSYHDDALDIDVHTSPDLRRLFDVVSRLISERKADRIERRAKRAEFLSGDRICGYHVTRLFRGAEVVFGPIESRMILERTGTQWLLKSTTNSLSGSLFPYTDMFCTDSLITLREIQERKRQ